MFSLDDSSCSSVSAEHLMPCTKDMIFASLDLFIKKLVIEWGISSPAMLFLVGMKAALRDADLDQVLCKHLGRGSPGFQLKCLSLQGMFLWQIWLLGQICAGALWQHKAPFQATQD